MILSCIMKERKKRKKEGKKELQKQNNLNGFAV